MDSSVKYGFGNKMCQSSSSIVTNVQVQDVDSGGGVHVWGQKDIWQLSVLSAQFFHECKTSLKNKV